MALTATPYRFRVELSDVDRGVYESLDCRMARHPSENLRYLLTRLFAYCLCYEPGLAFSKGGLSNTEEPPLAIHDATGLLTTWIEIGSPSAERLHRAAKAAPRVALFTTADLALLRREAADRRIHRLDEIEVWHLDARFLESLEPHVERTTALELTRTEGELYLRAGTETLTSRVTLERLA